MAKSRAQDSFADMVAQAPAPVAAPAKPVKRDDVRTSKHETITTRPHVSLYVSPKVQRTVKMLALQHGFKRPHDVYVEALRQFFLSRGEDFDALNRED